MCLDSRGDDPGDAVRIARQPWSDAYLSSRAIQRGYTYVVWRGPHVVEPTSLSAEQAAAYWAETLRVAAALLQHFRPLKLNYMTLGNSVPHLHTHLVPRFEVDPNPGGPFPIVPAEDPGPIAEEQLTADVARLRELLA